jgi:hypothetical protein
MHVVHLAEVGHVLVKIQESGPAHKMWKSEGNIENPRVTMCGRALSRFETVLNVMCDHSSPNTCQECVQALPNRRALYVQPVMTPAHPMVEPMVERSAL